MLPNLIREIPKATIQEIHEAAIEFYCRHDTAICRAEELYHRLWRGDSKDVIIDRWTPEAGERLTVALLELPPRAASILRQLLGGGRITNRQEVNFDSDDAIFIELRQVGSRRLLEGKADLEDIFDAADVPFSVLSPMGDLCAQAMVIDGQFEEMLQQVRALTHSRRTIPAATQARILMTASAVAEGLHEGEQAFEFSTRAHRYSADLEPVERLSIQISLIRLSRKIRRSNRGGWRSRRLRSATGLLAENLDRVLRQRVVKLEALAELMEVLEPEHSDWRDRFDGEVRWIFLDLLKRTSPVFASLSQSKTRSQELSLLLHMELDHEGEYRLREMLESSLMGELGREESLRIRDALRNEVDFGLSAAVGRDTAGRSATANALPDRIADALDLEH